MIKLAVDIVVFTIIRNELNVLLIKRKNKPFQNSWTLPGGFVEEGENLKEAAERELQEETGVKDIYLKKLTAYGDIGRDPRGRVVSIAFMGLIDHSRFVLEATDDALAAEWRSIDELKNLAFDHDIILKDALNELMLDVQTTNIAAQILPDKFTLTELQMLYEQILGKELDKRNFRKRIKALDFLKLTNESKMEGAHRPAALYKFREKDYKPLKNKLHIFL